MKKTAIIVEDEPLGMQNIKNHLRDYCPDIEVIGEATSNNEFLELIRGKNLRPDVALLDINLPDGTIFETLDLLRPIGFQIIFITAYDKFAQRACWYASMGYIVKPIQPAELVQAVRWVRSLKPEFTDIQVEQVQDFLKSDSHDRIVITDGSGMHVVNIADIRWIKADDNYSQVYVVGKTRPITVAQTLKSYQVELKGHRLFRIHKGHMIHIDHMVQFNRGKNPTVVMDEGEQLAVGRRRKAEFLEFLNRNGLGGRNQ